MGENLRAPWDQKLCVIGRRALGAKGGSEYLDSGFISLCKVANVSGSANCSSLCLTFSLVARFLSSRSG